MADVAPLAFILTAWLLSAFQNEQWYNVLDEIETWLEFIARKRLRETSKPWRLTGAWFLV